MSFREIKIFHRFNIADLIIAVIIIAGIAGFTHRASVSNPMESRKVKSVFYIEEVQDAVADTINEGDIVRDRVNGCVFGKITDIDMKEAASYGVNGKGEWVRSSKPGYVSLAIHVEGEGIYTENGVTVDNITFYVNKTIEIVAGKVYLWVKIASLEKVE